MKARSIVARYLCTSSFQRLDSWPPTTRRSHSCVQSPLLHRAPADSQRSGARSAPTICCEIWRSAKVNMRWRSSQCTRNNTTNRLQALKTALSVHGSLGRPSLQYGAPLRAHLWFGEPKRQHEGSGLLAPLVFFLPRCSTAARLFGPSSSTLDSNQRIEPTRTGNHLCVLAVPCVILLATH